MELEYCCTLMQQIRFRMLEVVDQLISGIVAGYTLWTFIQEYLQTNSII